MTLHVAAALVVAWSVLFVGCAGGDSNMRAGFVDAPVAAVAAPIPGQLAEVLVREGERVKKGQLLARLDTRERAAALAEAQANLEHARANVQEAAHNAEAVAPTLRGAEADIARQQAELDDAEAELRRVQSLVAQGAGVPSDLDRARARRDQARAAVEAMGATRQATRGKIGVALASVRTARAALLASEAAVELARVQLAEAEIRSPFDGIVAEQNLQPGEWAAAGTPVITVEDLSRLWVRVDVEETSLGALRLGQAAQIRVIAFPDRKYTGHLIEIGAEGEFALNRDVKRGRPDVRTFRVRIGFDRTDDALRPGMTAEVTMPSEGSRK